MRFGFSPQVLSCKNINLRRNDQFQRPIESGRQAHAAQDEQKVIRSLTGTRLLLLGAIAMTFCLFGTHPAFSQVSVLTQAYDNARTAQNVNETILTHAKVNANLFGKLFTYGLDGQMPAQPLYVSNVYIPATNSTHNVVYAATQHDSVYAFDADNNVGGNANPLWQKSFIDPANGITTIPVKDLICVNTGFTEFGIESTPVIDLSRNAIYVYAMTKENGNYVHRLHALDLGTGAELFGGPVQIIASVVIGGKTYTFNTKQQVQRPGLLLQNGIVYIGFGSPGCDLNYEMGWVMSYDASTLQQTGVWDDSPGVLASAVWMSGAGLAGDGNGNVYFSTGDGTFDADKGGNHYGDTVVKLAQGGQGLSLADFFTPYNQAYLLQNNLDLGAGRVILLPEQSNPPNNLALAVGKAGVMYLLDQSNLGGFNPVDDSQIVQEVDTHASGDVHNGLTYWNNNIFVYAENTPVKAFSFTNGMISSQPTSQTSQVFIPRGGIVSSNGTKDGVFWCLTTDTKKLFAFDATNLGVKLYDNTQAGSRDTLAAMNHFGMLVVANGRVYINGQKQLAVFGLLPYFAAISGNNQTGTVRTQLPLPLVVGLKDAYTNNSDLVSGIPVTFKDGGKGGIFSNPNTFTDGAGMASTQYLLPSTPGTYFITASSPGYASASFVVIATVGSVTSFAISSGNFQTAPVATSLPLPLKVRAKDASGNGVPGIQVSFDDGGAGGTLSPPSTTTDAAGYASTSYITSTKSGAVKITSSSAGLTSLVFTETVTAGPAVSMSYLSGNSQTVAAGAAAPMQLQVTVADQYANPVSGVSVSFSDAAAGGSFSPDPVSTTAKGIAGTRYTVPTKVGTVTVTASAAGMGSVIFTVNIKAGPAAILSIVSGNNQTVPNGTTLPQPLVVSVTDQYGNPFAGKTVTFSDGGAGGKFSSTSGVSNSAGQVSVTYTTPNKSGPITIAVSSAGLPPITFSETAQ